ncbi:DNA polymerase beta superfamily protein [Aureibacter tunicatorum]|uniref:Nucleotidyltransferase n=1 Tax=Aureibacter tunicatorum TaxID=866807 RepID=A0AAE3XGD9_9BACT|nr:nucleotidyltransferase domain-containing protein [Aureibacter tunicatorum]MDR6237111.1 hypothetical protein [Aureibacter tunicatorum]BDD06103.1 hypothetical protein AUTU_35860 [Aureibacter tunicatorum]
MTIEDLRKRGLIILECISGSRAYGLDTPASDLDIKGVFLLPKDEFYGLNYTPQVSNESNDIVFYEFNRFMELLSVNNPNILELLNTPESAIIYKHPYLDDLKSEDILSKLCKNTFGRFALSQIIKAKGLKKKIVNPIPKERKDLLSFCYVNYNQGSISVHDYLMSNHLKQENCGLVKIPHMNDVYGLYYSEEGLFNGIVKSSESNEISLSSVGKDDSQLCLLYFNRNGYSMYCKEYREYWEWVEKRNEVRYENTQSHGKNYDAKNMMHVFRLLDMAIEIGIERKINVKRPNKNFLLDVKSGKFEYNDLMTWANERQMKMEKAFDNSPLPDKPDINLINKLTYQIRNRFYDE